MTTDNNSRRTGSDEEVTDLFAAQNSGSDVELERVKKAAAERASQYTPSYRRKTAQNAAQGPKIEDFSDSAHYTMNRLNPEIQLTSVEEEFRRGHNGKSAADLHASYGDTTGYVPQQAVSQAVQSNYGSQQNYSGQSNYAPQQNYAGQQNYVPQQNYAAQQNYSGQEAAPRSYQNAQNYQAAQMYQNSQSMQNSQPVSYSQPMQNSQQIPYSQPMQNSQQIPAQGSMRNSANLTADQKLKTALAEERRRSEEIEAKENAKREEQEAKDRRQRIITIGIMAIIAVIMIAAIVLLALPDSSKKKTAAVQESSSTVVLQKDQQTYSGMISQLDAENGTMLVYNADTKTEKSFTTENTTMSLRTLKVGDMIDVVYDAANKDKLVSIMSCAKAFTVQNITGISVPGSQISINQELYTLDDNLICEYNGSSFSKDKITSTTVFNATIYNGHVYRIEVTSVPVSLTVENLGDYNGGTLIISSTDMEDVEKNITLDSETVEVPEGVIRVVVKYEHKTVYDSTIFAASDTENKIEIPNKDSTAGTVVFKVSGVDADVTVTIDNKDYAVNSANTMEYGTYYGKATADGYKEQTVQFTLNSAFKMVTLEMEEAKAPITINANVSGYSIWVDSAYESYTSSSTATVMLKPGVHWIVCMKDGYSDQGVTVVVDSTVSAQSVTLGGFTKLPEESSSDSSQNSSDSSSGNNSNNSSQTNSSESSTQNSSTGNSSQENSQESSQSDSQNSSNAEDSSQTSQ